MSARVLPLDPNTRRAGAGGGIRRRSGKLRDTRITLAHGGGGKAMRDLIDDVFVGSFDNQFLAVLDDQARVPLAELLRAGDRLAFTTDSYVVDPLFFPGADIGMLAVNGTVNDLAVGGARPFFLSCSVILEEGLDVETLRRVVVSMRAAAEAAGVTVITGDTKVVQRGAADQLFINTAGLGVIRAGLELHAWAARPGDAILVNGYLGDHGAAVLNARGDLALETEIESDCQPLNGLIDALLDACPEVRCLRDATRGGIATVLNEFALAADVGMRIDERALPIRDQVKGMCEILGLDSLYLANEGKLVAIVPADRAEVALDAMRRHPAGRGAALIGKVQDAPKGTVLLDTVFGGARIVDMLVGEQLPRIC
jgi:hydrogenase expression/formation protein HypE